MTRINKAMILQNHINQFNTMYPSASWMIDSHNFTLPDFCKHCSVYGYSFGNSELTIDGKIISLTTGQYFGLKIQESMTAVSKDKLFIVVRLGYKVMDTIGWVEPKGRLSYIDGCSDSLLVYPARLGDSSLNLLYFPEGISQTFHRHPSIRWGGVIDGEGCSLHGESGSELENKLTVGSIFGLSEHERHRFKTSDNSMTVLAFHPDGDWGPTDHNHTMLNRTYVNK